MASFIYPRKIIKKVIKKVILPRDLVQKVALPCVNSVNSECILMSDRNNAQTTYSLCSYWYSLANALPSGFHVHIF